MTERFEIFPQNVAKDGTLIIIQKGLKLYNISDVEELLNELVEENTRLKHTNQELYDKLQVTMSEKALKGGEIVILERENRELKGKLEVYQELYPSGKWICDLNSDELKKELSDDWG